MKHRELQLLVQGTDIATSTVTIDYPGVKLSKVNKADNKNFIFLDLILSDDVKAGYFNIDFIPAGKKKKNSFRYELRTRENTGNAHQGLTQRDVIYLITPDRFTNGNPDNDDVKNLTEKKNRTFHGGRHGGDIAGLISKIDYMNDLGVTAVWSNPLLENNMTEYSYHGYAITDYYAVDARYGTNDQYKKFGEALHNKNMKLVMDMVFNHCGREHWWMKDMPFADWIHYYPKMVDTNHAMASLSDPYGTQRDRELMEKGWFVSAMPDLNHDNPFMANYLIQNSVWWIEYAGLDGIRQDTYPYNKTEFMVRWAKHIHEAYPDFFLVGESWVDNEAQEAYWSSKGTTNSEFNSSMNSMTDFPLCFAIHKAFKKDGDVTELYRVLSKDFLYSDPKANKIFADNHDMDRFFYTIGQDINKFKLAMTFLLTTRGIPQLYYGAEINMMGHGEHGVIREDFPGGWPGDKRNAFAADGRTAQEKESFDFLQKLLQWRKKSDAIQNGNLKHFVPYDNLYVYNRKTDKESVVVIINNNAQSKKIDTTRYEEILKGYDGAVDIITDKKISNLNEIEIEGNCAMVLKLNPPLKAEK
jgi:glycosidase